MNGAPWPSRWPPPAAPAAPVPPLPSQMDGVTLRHLLRPFAAQEAAAAGRVAAAPEHLVANHLTSQSGLPARAGPDNELLAQVPGSYSTFGLAPDLTRANASNAAADIIDLTRAAPLSSAATLPKYPRHGLSASSSNEQSSIGALFLNKSANGMGTFTGESSANEGIANGGVQFQDSSVHALQKLPFKSMTHQHPTLPGDRIRVTCMNVGGEFFVGEAGLFGVICLCHRLRMSVAKFCEHAGGTPENAGEIVRVENGMSIAQWFKFCIGVGGSIANTRWDWPEWACMKSSPEEHILKSLASRNSGTGKMGLFGRFGKITGSMNKPAYSGDLSIEGGGRTNVEKLVNGSDETYYRKNVDVHEAFTKNSALLQNSATMNLGLAKNHPLHALDLNPLTTPSGSPHFEASMGRHYNGNHLAHSYGIRLEKNFDASFCNPMPRSTGVLNHDSRACRPNFPHKTFQDTVSNASNTELKLGQSSYHQSMTTRFPLGQSAMIEFQKPQTHRPPINQNPCPKQATKINKSLSEHNEPSISTGNKKQPLEVVNGTKHSEGDELMDDTSKNSFISLFLSHLERNNTPEPIDDILNSNEHYLPKALDVACGSDHPESATRQIETRAANDNHSKLTSAIDHMKRRSEGISLSVACSGYNPQDASHPKSQEHLIHGDSLSHLLPSQPNTGISKISARVSCHANCMSCTHVGNKSHQVAHGEIGIPCFYDKMARGHGTFERVDDCTHRSLRAFAKISCENGKSCCSSRQLLPSFCQNDQSTLGKSICGCCCKIQEDVSKLGFIPGHLCRTHFSSDVGPVLANKPTLEGLDEFCACSTSTQRSSLCSREYILQSSCYSCPIDGLHCRSSMGHAADSFTKHSLFDALNTKERGSCCNGRCCYSVVPKCLSSCGFTKHCDVRIDQIGHAAPKGKHQLQMPTRCCTLGENEKLTCQCLSNKIAVRNLSQTSHCKDVSDKVMNQPSIAIPERLENVSEASVADDSSSKAVAEKKDAYRDSVVSKGQPNFGFSSGSSSIIVTKFQTSPEFNNVSSSTAKHSKHKNLCDEGSRIEKCSSSSYVPTSTGCEEPLNSFAKSELGPSRVKRKCNQISEGRRLEEKDKEEHCFELPKKTRTLRCPVKGSESDDCTRASSQSTQKGGYQPQNEVNSFSCRVLRTKRKHPIMHLNKPVKRLHSQNKFFEGDEQPDAKGNFLGGLNSSDRKRQVEDIRTPDRTKHHQEGSRAFVRKLPKYVSLNCIVNEPNTNSEGACSGSGGIDSSLIATGITNDNRKSPKIVPLSLVLKKAKRCHVVKLCKTESTHLYEEKSSDCSVNSSDYSIDKYSVDDENCSPQAEYELQDSKRSRYSSNDLRSHVAHHKRTSGVIGEDGSLGLTDVETNRLSISSSSNGTKNRRTSVSLTRIRRHKKFRSKSTCYSGSDKDNAALAQEVNARRYSGRLNSDAPCCVCAISDLEPCNRLIECSKCYIKVHQACYGVLKVPRGQWFCRPCKTNTMNTVCVLCGYGGGAMTRALKTKNILKSLLKGLMTTERSENYVDSLGNASSECTSLRNAVDSAHGDSIMNAENITSNSWSSVKHNSSLLGPRTMQWVHMVCGLWTPGTKCPNATTMSAFDVSGASPAKRNTACSICDRTGGSFIKCRDVNCLVLFHAWCAHQRGLLQSVPEGEHNENVGFYGRCMDHAIDFSSHVNPKKEYLRSNNFTCARTEGFKGRKGEGFSDSSHKKYEEYSGEFSVSQEQINAWLRINGSKPCGRGQVVEYVGEIVGQRVADKREIEYQSGKRQQYKSACYFFKIDREHIIDATRKGGIARFVNHSCQPNCVAKIISVRNEKKVMFFAERHINPGEEITYDYHFNREDEGQRIPCFCRSRYCRRYLN
ncbi:uncharacterized protein [Miscanthus floridulus]|uniref:uncharacterized protein isoform X3 n=1 Tax=Miscanthus floridulus TaxID=154761 RepID=UPI00345A04E4